jgi:hypothetical protein
MLSTKRIIAGLVALAGALAVFAFAALPFGNVGDNVDAQYITEEAGECFENAVFQIRFPGDSVIPYFGDPDLTVIQGEISSVGKNLQKYLVCEFAGDAVLINLAGTTVWVPAIGDVVGRGLPDGVS